MRKARILAIICAILGILLIITFATYQYQVSPVDKSSKADIEVVIENGMSTDEIASLLEEKGLIRNNQYQKLQDEITIYPQVYFSPFDYGYGIRNNSDETICEHLFLVSWLPKRTIIKKFCKRLYQKQKYI